MVIYSHSRLSNYENCPLQFKFKYIDKIKDSWGIEAFLGSQVHEVIHYIYKKVKTGQIPALSLVLQYYKELWDKKFNSKMRIVRKEFSANDYFKIGEELISSYYEKYKPFNENIIGMEKGILIDLNGDGKYLLRGFIDKLIHNKEEGIYEIHDYKTNKSLKSQEELDKDKQLALYSLGVKDLYPDAKKIVLKWNFLRHGEIRTSSRTDMELKELKEKVIELIQKIEKEAEWPAKKSGLCDWCGYNHLCPEYRGGGEEFWL